jgi:hypothetical protein
METGLLCPVKQDKSKPPALERALDWGGGDENVFRDVFFELADVLQLEQTHPEVIPHFLDNEVSHDTSERHSRWAQVGRPEHSFNSVLMPALNLMARWKLDADQLLGFVREKGLPGVDHQGQPIQVGLSASLNPALMSFRLSDILLFEQAYPELKDGRVETIPSTSEPARGKVRQQTVHSRRPAAFHKEQVIAAAREIQQKHPDWDCHKIVQQDRIQDIKKKTTSKPYSLRKYLEWCREALKSAEGPTAE